MKKLFYILTLIFITPMVMNGQMMDPSLGLYGEQGSYMNPALTGQFDHKWQWHNSYKENRRNISNPYATIVSSIDVNLPINAWAGNIWGVGLRFLNDDQGDAAIRHTRANALFSIGQYLDPRHEHSLSVGFEGAYGTRSIDYGELYWHNQWRGTGFDIDPVSGNPNEPRIKDAKGYGDLAMGIQYTYRGSGLVDARVGMAMHHFLGPDVSLYLDGEEYSYDTKYTIHGDMEYRVNDHSTFYLRPSFLLNTQVSLTNVTFGNDFVFMFNEPTRTTGKRKEYSMSLGVYARTTHSTSIIQDIIPTFRLNLAGLTLGAGYDANIGNLNGLTNYQGGMEFFFGYKAGFKKGLVNKYHKFKTGL